MSKKTKKEFDYVATFDRLMNETVEGQDFKTSWSIFAGSFGGYITTRQSGKPLTKLHARVGRAISNALAEAQP
jgi:hypothetical protein